MTLLDSLVDFTARYHARATLVEEQRGWSRTIALCATDSGETIGVRVDDGKIVELIDACGSGDVIIRADHATLHAILTLQKGPNEPYLFGELTVQGCEADFYRLDYITAMLCPR